MLNNKRLSTSPSNYFNAPLKLLRRTRYLYPVLDVADNSSSYRAAVGDIKGGYYRRDTEE